MCVSTKDHQRAAEGAGQTSVGPNPRHTEALRSLWALLTGVRLAAARPAAHPRGWRRLESFCEGFTCGLSESRSVVSNS